LSPSKTIHPASDTTHQALYQINPIESVAMSLLRTSVLRLSRPIATRGYADKSMAEKAGDMLKKAGGAFKVSRATIT
jgi:hypothetical protein